MVNRSLLTISLLAVAPTVAGAQTPDNPGGTPPAATSGGDPYQKGTLGVAIPVATASSINVSSLLFEPVPTVDILYFLDPRAAVDIIAGINLHKEQISAGMPPVTMDKTVFGFAAGAGYRMYKHMDKLHSFIEPAVSIGWADTSNSSSFALHLAGYFGAERTVTDWFAFAGAIGAGVNFTNSFKDIQLATTATLFANFYWH